MALYALFDRIYGTLTYMTETSSPERAFRIMKEDLDGDIDILLDPRLFHIIEITNNEWDALAAWEGSRGCPVKVPGLPSAPQQGLFS